MIPKFWVNETFSVSDRWAKLTLKKKRECQEGGGLFSYAYLLGSLEEAKPDLPKRTDGVRRSTQQLRILYLYLEGEILAWCGIHNMSFR
jgi:hypothetical protein